MPADIEEQYDKLYRYCYFKVHDEYLAEDITQEAFIRYLESDSYKNAGKPLAFLYTIAKNLCIDEFRRKKPEEISDNIPADVFEEQVIEKVSVRMALEELTEREREMVLLKFVNEVAVSDIGKIFGISRFAVYRQQFLKEAESRKEDLEEFYLREFDTGK